MFGFKKKEPQKEQNIPIKFRCPYCGAEETWNYKPRRSVLTTCYCKNCKQLSLIGQTTKTSIAVIKCEEFMNCEEYQEMK
jgi:transcription elongation factor Elf1